jgi:osmotically inducible protein OsmC
VLVRKSSAIWEGDLKQGKGTMKVGPGVFEGSYSFSSRFEQGEGTNPEELIGAAHAGCFSMALAGEIAQKGYSPKQIRTTAEVSLDKTDQGFRIKQITLSTEAEIPGIGEGEFQSAAEAAKSNCPVSRALTGVDISLNARLAG